MPNARAKARAFVLRLQPSRSIAGAARSADLPCYHSDRVLTNESTFFPVGVGMHRLRTATWIRLTGVAIAIGFEVWRVPASSARLGSIFLAVVVGGLILRAD